VIARARADRVDVAPVAFRLWVLGRVPIYLGGRRLQYFDLEPLGKPQHVDRSVHAGLRCLHGIELVVHWRGRTGQIVDLVDLYIERPGDVMPNQLEHRMTKHRQYVRTARGEEVVYAKNFVAAGEKPLAEMRTDKSCAACHEHAFHRQCLIGTSECTRWRALHPSS